METDEMFCLFLEIQFQDIVQGNQQKLSGELKDECVNENISESNMIGSRGASMSRKDKPIITGRYRQYKFMLNKEIAENTILQLYIILRYTSAQIIGAVSKRNSL
ncbi:Hypothetical_protein [Hexamita inflata]|uniref:Hypothetical_protein n=1 Tax=Hexamita inflata TaxID=28002 RepID=A0AA86RIM6_9EUKA|nr:Hypothetical protein HINF_LOCUS63133 [Hexamita inflata]